MLSSRHRHNIDMQHSKSHGSFSSGHTSLITRQRPRARSSLDTFVIPGRTRIPSSKPDPIDIQIAETLLNPITERLIRGSQGEMSSSVKREDAEAQRLLTTFGIQVSPKPKTSSKQFAPHGECQRPKTSLSGAEPSSLYTLQPPQQSLYKVRPEISKRPPPQIGGRDILIVPPQRSRKVGASPPLKRLGHTAPRKVTPPTSQARAFYDGAIGSSYELRTTSMTWSTISHRMLTDSSESSQCLQAPESLEEFNRLARQHGIPSMEKCPGGKCCVLKPF